MLAFRILYEDDFLVAADKPAGFHTHAPEDPRVRISPRWNGLQILQRQLGHELYPVHRLDRATSGILVLSKRKHLNSELQRQFAEQKVFKRYGLVARGNIPLAIKIEEKLKKKTGGEADATTEIDPLHSFCLAVEREGCQEKRVFTIAWAHPLTGRFHQIRRHCAHRGYPLVGDSQHGDKKLNRALAAQFGLENLLLRCMEIRICHPVHSTELRIKARWGRDWHRLFACAGYCPVLP